MALDSLKRRFNPNKFFTPGSKGHEQTKYVPNGRGERQPESKGNPTINEGGIGPTKQHNKKKKGY